MSNRRKTRPAAGKPRDPGRIDALAPLADAGIPGGCDHCAADQVVFASAFRQSGVNFIQVFHDPWCPVWGAS
jgi:hypothetical protein